MLGASLGIWTVCAVIRLLAIALGLALIFGAVACSWNDYDYRGAPTKRTPYDDLYGRVEWYLERNAPEPVEQPQRPSAPPLRAREPGS